MEKNKILNMSNIHQQMELRGKNQSDIAVALEVSRQSVSQWFNNESFPRPGKLLKLGRLLSLKFSELILEEDFQKPQVAFRKVANSKTTELHVKRAENTGYDLRLLVPYLPFDTIIEPKHLRDPKLDYQYIQKAVSALRDLMKINSEEVEIVHILEYFHKQHTILIPKLMGSSKNHNNALHIKLPESGINWVFFNLDTNLLDFKFWLVHELAHTLSPTISENDKEIFADEFAGAFLYTEKMAERLHTTLKSVHQIKRFDTIFNEARRLEISPYTILSQYNKFAEYHVREKIEMGNDFHARRSNFEKKYPLVSSRYFGTGKPDAKFYISICESEFRTPFFEAVRKYLKNHEASASLISSLLDISVTDSIEIFRVLKDGI